MQIYLLRHGIAEAASAGMADADRALTSEGKKKIRDLAGMAAAAGVKPTLVLSSPYKRAVTTARIAAEEFSFKGDIVTTQALLPEASPEAVWNEIRVYRQQESILLVGHEPLFGALAAYLLGAPQLQIDFKKGALLCLEAENFGPQPRGVLKWFVTARFAGANA
jgi:phosphohistidine phosphatase